MKGLLIPLALLLVVPAFSQSRTPGGVEVGIFMPSNGATREAFGDVWFRFGFSPKRVARDDDPRLAFDFAWLHQNRSGNSVTLIPITFGIVQQFGSDDDVVPYYAARVGPYYADVRSSFFGVDDEGVGFTGNVAVGMGLSETIYIEARYDFYSKFNGIDFSGFMLSAGFRLFDVRL